MKDKSADGIRNGGVFLNTPVNSLDITVDKLLIVKDGGLHIADFFSLFTIENVSLRNVVIARLNKHGLNAVLNILNGNKAVFYLVFKI